MTCPFRAALAATLFAIVPALAQAQQSAPPVPRNYPPQPPAAPYANPQYGSASVPLQRDVARVLPNGCRYAATVRGQFTQVGPIESQLEPQVQPSLTIGAQVTCANGWATNLSENVVSTAPIAISQLEDSLDRRGTVFVESFGQRCAYIPQFAVDTLGRLDLDNVAIACSRSRGRRGAPPPPAQRIR